MGNVRQHIRTAFCAGISHGNWRPDAWLAICAHGHNTWLVGDFPISVIGISRQSSHGLCPACTSPPMYWRLSRCMQAGRLPFWPDAIRYILHIEARYGCPGEECGFLCQMLDEKASAENGANVGPNAWRPDQQRYGQQIPD